MFGRIKIEIYSSYYTSKCSFIKVYLVLEYDSKMLVKNEQEVALHYNMDAQNPLQTFTLLFKPK